MSRPKLIHNSLWLFEPESRTLEPLGLSATESLVSVDQQGHMFIPVHNSTRECVLS